jgi:hypothetical protein
LRDGAYVTDPVLNDGAANYTLGTSERRSGTSTWYHAGFKNAESQTAANQTVAATKTFGAFGNPDTSSGTWKGPFGYGGPFGPGGRNRWSGCATLRSMDRATCACSRSRGHRLITHRRARAARLSVAPPSGGICFGHLSVRLCRGMGLSRGPGFRAQAAGASVLRSEYREVCDSGPGEGWEELVCIC